MFTKTNNTKSCALQSMYIVGGIKYVKRYSPSYQGVSGCQQKTKLLFRERKCSGTLWSNEKQMEGRPKNLCVIVKNPLLDHDGSQTSLDKAYTLRVLSPLFLEVLCFIMDGIPDVQKYVSVSLFKQFLCPRRIATKKIPPNSLYFLFRIVIL